MADLAIGIARSVVEGTLTKAQAAIEEESNLRQDAQRDLVFITGELQMMQSFLGAVGKERAKNVVKTWAGQVRDVAYDVEDCIELVAHLDNKSDCWRRLLPLRACIAAVLPLDKAVAEIKQLKPRIVDVSHRITQYGLTGVIDLGSTSRPITHQEPAQAPPPDAVSATAVNMPAAEARDSMRNKLQGLGDLVQLMIKENDDLGVISAWGRGAGSDLGRTSVIRELYQDGEICQKFGCRGWIRLTYPFNPHKFLQSLVTQFYSNSCLQQGRAVDVAHLRRMTETTAEQELIAELMNQLSENRYLIVLENVCTMGEWDAIRAFLPRRNKGNCIVLSTEQREIAILCIGRSYQVLELEQYSPGHPVYVFFKEDSQSKEIGRVLSRNKVILMEDEVNQGGGNMEIPSSRKAEANSWLNEFSLVGRESQMTEVRRHITKARFDDWQVMSVWGIAGVGKSVLIRSVYYKIMLGSLIFDKFGWVRVSHPFNLRDISQSLLLNFHSVSSIEALGVEDPIQECHKLLKERQCLVVIDGVKSTEEWDLLQPALVSNHSKSVIIVIATEETIATYCADNQDVVLNVKCLDAEASFDLFRKQVQRKNPDSPLLKCTKVCSAAQQQPNQPAVPLTENQAASQNQPNLQPAEQSLDKELEELILKCGGLPKVIASVAGYLAPKTVTCMESTETLNRTFMHSLQHNSEFVGVRGIFHWLDAYIGTWPDFLKQCIVYLSVFSRYQPVRRRLLLRRWIAEGYIKDSQTVSAEESGERSFSRLLDTCIAEQSPDSVSSVTNDTGSVLFQINRFVGQYILSQPTEENLFIELEESCTVATQRIGRHLSIRKNWARDKTVFESIEFSRLRSLTVFGRWESFFISESMKVLRVLDLENSSGVTDKDLEKIVKLLSRLKFLSLRGCREIRRLPRRMGDLRQLETLDVSGTSVSTIQKSTLQLKKLQYMRAGTTVTTTEPLTQRASIRGVNLPEGIEKLTLLTTLGVFDIRAAAGKAIVKELNKLTQLCKLGVSGVNKKNAKEFCAAISCHVRLESLSVWLSKENQDCSDNIMSHLEDPQPQEKPKGMPHQKALEKPRKKPLQNLHSLKIYGLGKEVPAWIRDLPKLTKLELEITISAQADIITEILGEIRQLCILRLYVKPLQDDGDAKLDFCLLVNSIQQRCYLSLKVLDITATSKFNICFGSEAMQNLELLTARCCSGSAVRFFELRNLSKQKLKEVRLIGAHDSALKNDIEGQLREHPRKPTLKLC